MIGSQIMDAESGLLREFLRALFDDEGSVKSKYEIGLYSINKSGLIQIQELLNRFKINSRICPGYGQNRNVYAIIIRDFIQFHNNIGFSLKRKQKKLMKYIHSA